MLGNKGKGNLVFKWNMPLGTPKHRATLWVFANAAWIAVSPAAALYFDRQQRNGAYPVDADSIGLPIMGIAVWGKAVTPVMIEIHAIYMDIKSSRFIC
jgi:hypothetical protein